MSSIKPKEYSLSILIAARNEEFLSKTVENILENKNEETQIIVGLDEKWANPPIKDHPDVIIVHSSVALGQRAMCNLLCRISRAKYVMKLDGHCTRDKDFDRKMFTAFKETGDNVIMVPAMYNLHVFDWKCMKCGKRTYMGPKPHSCEDCDNTTNFEKKIVWTPRWNRRTESWMFDKDLHFQYWGDQKRKPGFKEEELSETMSLIGACWMVTRDKYWELNLNDEEFGSWGQMGTELSCKIHLSGGKLIVNKRTWYSHLFRTQKDFGFPYPQSNTQVNNAREKSKELFIYKGFKGQIHPISWMIEKYMPISGWTQEDLDAIKKVEF
jgi:rubrerythrin